MRALMKLENQRIMYIESSLSESDDPIETV
jgi:hypothetical protein